MLLCLSGPAVGQPNGRRSFDGRRLRGGVRKRRRASAVASKLQGRKLTQLWFRATRVFPAGGHMSRDGGGVSTSICVVPVRASVLKHWLRMCLGAMRWSLFGMRACAAGCGRVLLVVLAWCAVDGRRAAGSADAMVFCGVCLRNSVLLTSGAEAKSGSMSARWCRVHSGLERLKQCGVHLPWVCMGGSVCKRA